MARLRIGASNRPAARLISTPITEEHFMSSTVIAGVRFSDQLAALLDHAHAHGFRISKDERGRGAKGVCIFPPDKNLPPITVEERGAKFNPAHFDNIRRQLYRAGCPPLPGDAKDATEAAAEAGAPVRLAQAGPVGLIAATTAEEALKALPEGSEVLAVDGHANLAEAMEHTPNLRSVLGDIEQAPRYIAGLTEGLAQQAGVGRLEADLISALVQVSIDWALMTGGDKLNEASERIRVELAAKYEEQIDAALAIAEEAAKAADAAIAQKDRSEAREKQARADCGAALERAEAAEAKAKELDAAIAPLRNLLGGNA